MTVFIEWIHAISCIGLIVVIMFQVTKSEGGSGGLGWGTIGGKASSSLNVSVGVERILNPLTFWCAVTFLVTALLHSIDAQRLGPALIVIVPVYITLIIFGKQILAWVKKAFGAE